MLIPLLCLLPSFSLSLKTPDERTEMVRIVRLAARETERALAKVDRIYLRCDYLTQIADSLEGIDDAYAMKVINQDWKLAISNPDEAWQDYTDIGAIASRMNASIGANLLKKIPTRYQDHYEASTLAYSLWYRQPSKAVHVFNEGQDVGFNEFELARDLAILRLDIALSFLKMLHPDRRDEFAYIITSDLNKDEKKRFALSASKLITAHTLQGWNVLHPDASAAELEAGSKLMTDRWDYASMRMLAAKAYLATDRKHACSIADGLCQEAKRGSENPYYVLLPEIGRFDTPTVRAYITGQETKTSDYPFMTIGAWSFIDIDKARKQLDTALTKKAKTSSGHHGESLAPGLADLLKNLIKTHPEEAADRLGQVSLHQMGPSDRQEMNFSRAVDFIKELWKDNEAQVRRFCLTSSPWQKHLGKNPTLIVDFLKAKDALMSAKQPMAKDLKLFQVRFQSNDMGKSRTTDYAETLHEIIMRTAAENPAEASRMIKATIDSPEFYCEAFEAARHLPFAQRRPLLEEAIREAHTSNDNQCHWPKIAATAKRSWQRLQPWPPAR